MNFEFDLLSLLNQTEIIGDDQFFKEINIWRYKNRFKKIEYFVNSRKVKWAKRR